MQKSVHVQRQVSVAYRPVPEVQKDTAIRQGAAQGGRSVQPQQAVIRPFSQMVAVPDRFQRATAKCEVAMDSASGRCMKTASIRQAYIPVTERRYHDKPEFAFQIRVNSEIERLNKIDPNRGDFDTVLYCLAVARSCRNLLQLTCGNKKRVSKPGNLSFLIARMAPIYNTALKNALKKAQQDLAEGKNSRGYAQKLDIMTKPIDILLDGSPDRQNYKTTLHALFRHCIDNELTYLESMTLETSPSAYAVHASADAIESLLEYHASICRLSLMSASEIKTIRERRDKLLSNIFPDAGNGTIEREKEKRDILKKDVSPEITNMLAKMKVFDELKERFDKTKEQFDKIKKETGKNAPEDVQQCTCILKELAEICNHYDQSGIEFLGFPGEMRKYLSIVTKKYCQQ